MSIKNLTTTYKNFELRAIQAQKKNAPWKDEQDRTHCHYTIRVKNTDTKLSFMFDYWTSLAKPEIDSNGEILQAFECFLDDCLVATDTLKNFMDDFEVDEEKEARRIYAGCGRSLRKMERIYDGSLVDLANDLQEYICNMQA